MREIIFKAKRVDNGEWVEGNFYESKISGCYILQTKTISTKKYGEVKISDKLISFEVIPETVSEFTGLTDKNGNKIFEGDKVNILHQNEVLTGIIEYLDDRFIVAVGMWAGDLRTYVKTRNLFCEVIGNIHEGEENGTDK